MDLLLTPEEAARMLGLSLFTVRRLLRQGDLPGRKVGKRQWRISRVDLEEYLRVPDRTVTLAPPFGVAQKEDEQDRIALLAAQQGVSSVADFDLLLAMGDPDNDDDAGFVAAIRDLREVSPAGV